MDHSQTPLKLQMLNCNSLNTKLPEIKQLLLDTCPHVLCLCETWLSERFTPRFHGYASEWVHRPARQGGGLGILIKQEVQYSSRTLTPYLGGVLEVQVITLFLKDGSSMSILNIYNPGGHVTHAEFSHYIKQLDPKFLIVGDLNAHTQLLDSSRIRSNPTGRSLESLLLTDDICLINPENMPTYVDRRTGAFSCLDVCLSSSNLAPGLSLEVLQDVGSDHLLLQLTASFAPHSYTWTRASRFRVTEPKLQAFQGYYSPSSLSQPADLDTLVLDFTSRLTQSATECFGLPSSPVLHPKKKTPWWSKECQTAVNERRKAFRTFQKHPTTSNFNYYKQLSAKAKLLIKSRKKLSFHEFVSSIDHTIPPAAVWKKLKALTAGYKPSTYPLEQDGARILGPQQKADHLCEFFASQSTTSCSSQLYTDFVNMSCMGFDTLLGHPITDVELSMCLISLRSKAPGHDLLPNNILQNCHSSYKSELLCIFNQSLAEGVVPSCWKFGLVSPIPKLQKQQQCDSSYRPITLLPCIGKLMERIIHKRLDYFIESHHLLSSAQFGFRSARGLEDVVMQLSHKIRIAVDGSSSCGVVYLDLKGAFDRVWQQGLLYKIAQLGINGNMLRWLRSYLTDRTQSVVVHGYTSACHRIQAGVPQGGVLSPLLFNVMMSDIPLDPSVCTYVFADDITLACTGHTPEEARAHLQRHLDVLDTWFTHWGFTLNPTKTTMQFFTRKRGTPPPTLTLQNSIIERVPIQRLLGVYLDAPRLTWKAHIQHLVVNCYRRIDVLKSISSSRWGASYVILRQFYLAYIRSKLSFCGTVFSTASKSLLTKLTVIQNTCLRLIIGARRSSPVLSLEAEAGIPPIQIYLDYRAAKQHLKMLFKPDDDSTAEIMLHHPTSSISLRGTNSLTQVSNAGGQRLPRNKYCFQLPPLLASTIVTQLSSDAFTPSGFGRYLATTYQDFTDIYTDGSRFDGPPVTVASGVYVPTLRRGFSWKLHPDHTVVSSELFAIWRALTLIHDHIPGNCVIFSDSLTSLQMVGQSGCAYSETVRPIQSLLGALNTHRTVHLHWVQAHCGIPGNTVADRTAKQGHLNDRSTVYPLHLEERLVVLFRSYKTFWNNTWKSASDLSQKGLFLRQFRETILFRTPVDTGKRRIDVALFRLRIGHAGVNSYLYRFNQSESPACRHCEEDDTIEHYLLYCEYHELQRGRLYLDIAAILQRPFTFTVALLLGGENVPLQTNTRILNCVGRYLVSTGMLPFL